MAGTGILIELENGTVKETSLGVMTAAADHDIHALILDEDVSAAKDTLAEYGAKQIIVIKADDALAVSPDLQAQALAATVKEYGLDTLLATASALGGDLMARVGAMSLGRK